VQSRLRELLSRLEHGPTNLPGCHVTLHRTWSTNVWHVSDDDLAGIRTWYLLILFNLLLTHLFKATSFFVDAVVLLLVDVQIVVVVMSLIISGSKLEDNRLLYRFRCDDGCINGFDALTLSLGSPKQLYKVVCCSFK